MTDRIALITGGARGLGLAVAETLGAGGYSLCLVDRDPGVEQTAADIRARGVAARAEVADLTKDDEVRDLVARVGQQLGKIDVLVNNAGITRDARLAKMSEDDFSAVIDVNLVAPMRLTAALEPLFSDGAAIVNMSSRAALGNFGQTNYVASKSGLIAYTRALALSMAPKVRVNAVAPGLIESAMTGSMPDNVLADLVAKIPAARIGQPEDIARAVAFLASDDASYITGQVITVCGGRSVAP